MAMKIIGLTGGIGSGKSFVAGVATGFFPVFHISTDDIAREQMQRGGCSYNAVLKAFSEEDGVVGEDGELDRQQLSKVVFANRKKLDLLNSITHPNVIEEMKRQIREAEQSGEYEAVLIESALIFESGINTICDSVWYVYAPTDCRKQRLKMSRGYSDEKTESILDDQMSDDEFMRLSDETILNDDSVTVEMMVLRISELLV